MAQVLKRLFDSGNIGTRWLRLKHLDRNPVGVIYPIQECDVLTNRHGPLRKHGSKLGFASVKMFDPPARTLKRLRDVFAALKERRGIQMKTKPLFLNLFNKLESVRRIIYEITGIITRQRFNTETNTLLTCRCS